MMGATKSQTPNAKSKMGSELDRDRPSPEQREETKVEDRGEEGQGARLGARLKRVQRRKRARPGAECDVLAQKLRTVKTKEEVDH